MNLKKIVIHITHNVAHFCTFPLILILCFVQCKSPEKPEISITTVSDANGYYPPPHVRTYPSSSDRINEWIKTLDNDSIRIHAWDIWESITTSTDSITQLPVWETWYSGYELFNLVDKDSKGKLRDFQFPSQNFHASVQTAIPEDPFERPVSFNRYTKTLAEFISDQGYNRTKVLDSINASFNLNNTPIIDRQIQTSVDSTEVLSFALKPVFQFISGDIPTALPYWAGVSVESTTELKNPEPHTWRQCVVIDPTGKLKPGDSYTISCNGEAARPWPVVSIDDFYTIAITQEIEDNFSEFAKTSGDDVGSLNKTDSIAVMKMVKKGNYALLTAMHVTGKEINNWTWQTFWWTPNKSNPVFGKNRPPTIQSPWSNYNMRTAYYMVAPMNTLQGGEPLISFNPYLETNLKGKVPLNNKENDSIIWYGVFSNCMSCHRIAAYPSSNYVPDGFINSADPLKFSKNTKTDFLWSIPIRALPKKTKK